MFTLQLYNLLRPRVVVLAENETIAGFNEEKFPEWAKLQQNWVNTLISFHTFFHYRNMDIA